jgi:diadenylate cyclase
MIPAFLRIGFLELRVIDVVDILLVGFLIYQLYRLIRGSLAYNIFIGLLIVYGLSLLFRALDMELISGILGQFIGVGVLALLIVFQPEVRRFLLLIGRGSELRRSGLAGLWRRLNLRRLVLEDEEADPALAAELAAALERLARRRVGALLVFSGSGRLLHHAGTGKSLDAKANGPLIESIFQKDSPLHDGALIVARRRLVAAACILPVSENPDLPPRFGLRHRAAAGITEQSDATAVVVSEERGEISVFRDGRVLATGVERARLERILAALLGTAQG